MVVFVIDLKDSSEYHLRSSLQWLKRGVAQSGSASALGAECREFESLHPDQFIYAPVAHQDRASAF
jgi:hypothetical protein